MKQAGIEFANINNTNTNDVPITNEVDPNVVKRIMTLPYRGT